MDSQEKLDLKSRTRARHATLRDGWGWGGLFQPVSGQEEAINALASASIEAHLGAVDEALAVKETKRDKTFEVDSLAVRQELQIAEMKADTARLKLALQKSTDTLVLAVQTLNVKIRDHLMAAKEFAAAVELEALAVEEAKASLAVDQEILKQEKANAQLFMEYVARAMVDAEVAREKVNVAKAQIRAIIADIEAGEAEIKLIDANVRVATAEAEKATIQADVAMIFAEVATKQLSQIKLDVGRAEIQAGFEFIQTRLNDTLAIFAEKEIVEQVQTEAMVRAFTEEQLLQPALYEEINLLAVKQLMDEAVFANLKINTYAYLDALRTLKNLLIESLDDQTLLKTQIAMGKDNKQTWAQQLVNTAHSMAYKLSQTYSVDILRRHEYIQGE